jgi:hypothetical protein
MSEQETILKTIRMPKDLHEQVQAVAQREHRSFSKQVLFFLEQELTHDKTHSESIA